MKRSCTSPLPIPPKSQPNFENEKSSHVGDECDSNEYKSNTRRNDQIGNGDQQIDNEVFSEFRRLDGEFQISIQMYERQNLYLSNVLSHLRQDVELLKKKKELQKAALIHLQINLEKLDGMRPLVQSECRLERDRNYDIIRRQLKQMSDNNIYLVETQDKVKLTLLKDKGNADRFLDEIRQYSCEQSKSCADLKNKIESAYESYYQNIFAAKEEEHRIDGELESFVSQYKNYQVGKEKFEYEMNEKSASLSLIKKESLELEKQVQLFKERLKQMVETNVQKSVKLSNYVELHKEEVDLRQMQIEELTKKIEHKTLELDEKEKAFNEAIETHTFLLKEKETVHDNVQKLTEEIEILTEQNDKLRRQINDKTSEMKATELSIFEAGQHQIDKEKELLDKKNLLKAKLTEKIVQVQNIEKQLALLNNKKHDVKAQFEAMKLKNDEYKNRNDASERELSDLLVGLDQVDSNIGLDEKMDELKELNDKKRCFEKQILLVEMESKSVGNQISELEERNAALDRELEIVSSKENETIKSSTIFQEEKKRLRNLKKEIAVIKEEVGLAKVERNVNVEQLEGEIKKVEQEIRDTSEAFEAKKESVESSYNRTELKLNGLLENMRTSFDDEMRIKCIQVNHLMSNLPQLQREIALCKSDLMTMIGKNTAKMKERLLNFKQMMRGYKNLYNRARTAGGSDFTTVRLMGIIEEHLKPSMQGMMEYLGMSSVEISTPFLDVYSQTLDNFEVRFQTIISEINSQNLDPSRLEELKRLGFCLFGLQRTDTFETVGAPENNPFFSPSSSIN